MFGFDGMLPPDATRGEPSGETESQVIKKILLRLKDYNLKVWEALYIVLPLLNAFWNLPPLPISPEGGRQWSLPNRPIIGQVFLDSESDRSHSVEGLFAWPSHFPMAFRIESPG
jgi:hypothetical protein